MTKLALFTVAMVLFPIGTYYLTRDYVFARALRTPRLLPVHACSYRVSR